MIWYHSRDGSSEQFWDVFLGWYLSNLGMTSLYMKNMGSKVNRVLKDVFDEVLLRNQNKFQCYLCNHLGSLFKHKSHHKSELLQLNFMIFVYQLDIAGGDSFISSSHGSTHI